MQGKIELVAEENDFLVIDKPNGMGMHDEEEVGLDSLIRSYFDDKQLSAAHRLDRGTSGLLLVAKGKEALSKLSMLFQNRDIKKYYWAISSRKPKKKQGTIDGGMVKSRNGSWIMTKSGENRAITQFFSFGLGNGRRAFIVKPYSGKTHQIRVALKSLGAPVLGDARYNGADADRLYLHAANLDFCYEGKNFEFSCMPSVGESFQAQNFLDVFNNIKSVSALKWPAVRSWQSEVAERSCHQVADPTSWP